MQHALALGVPGAELSLASGRPQASSKHGPSTCAPAPLGDRATLTRRSTEGAGAGSGHGPSAGCSQVMISIPAAHAPGFRAMLKHLKKRAFRLESSLIAWRGDH